MALSKPKSISSISVAAIHGFECIEEGEPESSMAFWPAL